MTMDSILCNKMIINKEDGLLEMGTTCDSLNSFDAIQNECKNILKEIESINNHIGAGQIESELMDLLSALSENRYLKNMCSLDGGYLNNGGGAIICACQTSDLIELLRIHSTLCRMPVRQYFCIIEKSTDKDKQEVMESLDFLKKHHPESLKIYEKNDN